MQQKFHKDGPVLLANPQKFTWILGDPTFSVSRNLPANSVKRISAMGESDLSLKYYLKDNLSLHGRAYGSMTWSSALLNIPGWEFPVCPLHSSQSHT